MDTLGGLRATGRQIVGPASNVVELEDESSREHLAIVFHEPYRQHLALTRAVDLALSFLEFPMVVGLHEVVRHVPEEGAFIYPSGQAWTLTELARTFRDAGKTLDVRAVLDLCYLASRILQEGAENGPQMGVFSHLDLTPDRILIDGEGQVTIIGYGLPMIELLAHLDGSGPEPREDTWRYCPPERLEGRPEDVTSDLYSLVLIAYELITGDSLLGSDPKKMREVAQRGEAVLALRDKPGKKLPADVREVFAQALEFDPASRYDDALAFQEALAGLYTEKLQGAALVDVMQRVGPGPRRGRTLQSVSRGAAASAGAPVAVPRGPAAPARPLPAPVPGAPGPASGGDESRWGKVQRGRRSADEGEGRSLRRSADGPRRLPRRGEEEPAEEAAVAPTPEAEEESGGKRKLPRRVPKLRKREDKGEEDAPAETAAAPAEPAEAPAETAEAPAEEGEGKRRLRRSTGGDEEGDEKRRLRRSTGGDEEGDEKRRLPRRLPRRASAGDDPPAEAEEEAPRRLPRRASASKDEAEEAGPRRLPRRASASKDEPERPKRRLPRRGGGDEEAEDEPAPKRPRRRAPKKKTKRSSGD